MKRWLTALLLGFFFAQSVLATTIWRNPGPYPEGMDTWFGNVYSTTAQHDNRLIIGGWGDIYQTLLRFDLSGLPQTADSVYLYLNPTNAGTPTNINWYLITNQWQSGTVNTNTNLGGALIGTTDVPDFAYWYVVNITSIYNQWRLGGNYGFHLKPVSNNNNYTVFKSSTYGGGFGPWLQVNYTPQANNNIIKLKWPLGTPYANRVINSAFGADWNNTYCNGLIKKHNGTDFSATAGTAVYAAEDGVVKEFGPESTGQWASRIVLEHNHPTGGKYTTVYWHVNPISLTLNDFIPKGMQIATVANLGGVTHFHFGVRIGSYNNNTSGTGSLPQTNCGIYPAFPENFIDPNNTNNILFQ